MFNYTDIEMPEDCKFKISPSQIAKFFNYPPIWYKEQILKETEDIHNTSMVIGTVCHYIFEKVALGEHPDVEYINNEIDKLEGENLDHEKVKDIYPSVAEKVVNEYLLKNMPTKVEHQCYAKVLDGVYVGGTIDNITNSIVTDYKIVAAKPPAQIPFNYRIQLLSYAYILNRQNIFVDRIRIVYGVKPTKTLFPRTYVVTEMITFQDWQLINDTLKLIAETIYALDKYPEITHLLFKSMNLKKD